MLFIKCMHPQLLGAIGKLGHGSWILIADGGYPYITATPREVEKVYLNLTQGVVSVPEVIEVLKATLPIEEASVMTPPDGTMQPVFETYKQLLPDVPFNYISQFTFYEHAQRNNIGLVIATGDMHNYANLLIKVGVVKHPEGKGNY